LVQQRRCLARFVFTWTFIIDLQSFIVCVLASPAVSSPRYTVNDVDKSANNLLLALLQRCFARCGLVSEE
jgi:hypothetical protein